jgi:hypothetical protein
VKYKVIYRLKNTIDLRYLTIIFFDGGSYDTIIRGMNKFYVATVNLLQPFLRAYLAFTPISFKKIKLFGISLLILVP